MNGLRFRSGLTTREFESDLRAEAQHISELNIQEAPLPQKSSFLSAPTPKSDCGRDRKKQGRAGGQAI
jgi:hypothetical protein